MVGQLMVEDEYTINVKLRRPLGEGRCLAPPTLTFSADSPALTLTPPPDAAFKDLRATRTINGAPAITVGTQGRRPELYPGQYSLPAPGESCHVGPPLPPQVLVGRVPLPLVQVYSHDNDLVATNTFMVPRDRAPSPPPQPHAGQLAIDCPTSAAGTLFVPRIPAHCKSDCGVLYVPPVEERQLRGQLREEIPTRGNSRRRCLQGMEGQLVPYTEREAASRAAARALLSNVLTPRMDAEYLSCPRSSATDLHLSSDGVSLSLGRPRALTWGGHDSTLAKGKGPSASLLTLRGVSVCEEAGHGYPFMLRRASGAIWGRCGIPSRPRHARGRKRAGRSFEQCGGGPAIHRSRPLNLS
ncbi:uncharacterized protein LOC126982467 isoform X10 [Eriocheir sinensis]|uniref:uncharacterized protein LOC126982467 isoform X10 n=1 Tax=Eriocheir sinensis TaxID=95602 RepID=UPI0021C83369|nr:uncharacterized protein LOC126982467 isoform X10 [Eriocheir sinensis]